MAELKYTSNGSLVTNANLRAYYRMESGALTIDSGSNGYTLTNNGTVASGTGKFVGAADFGAANSSKYFSTNHYYGISDAMSVSFWVKLSSEISADSYNFFFIERGSTNRTYYTVYYDYNAGTRRLRFRRQKPNVATNEFTHNVTLGTSDWYHIVYTFSGSTVTGYLNGSSVGSVSASGFGTGTGTDQSIIGAITGSSNYLSGLMDDIAIFDRELTSGEVTALYNDVSASTNTLTNYRPRKRTPGTVSI